MSKFLAYEFSTERPITVDTINLAKVNLGPVLPLSASIETTNFFDPRICNNVTVFLGDVFLAVRTDVNSIRIYKYAAGVWTVVSTTFPMLGNQLGIGGFHVNNNRLTLMFVEQSAVPLNVRYGAITSIDGITFAPLFSVGLTGFVGLRAPTALFKQAVFMALAIGIWQVDATPAFISATPDTGSDGAIITGAQQSPECACFATWNGDLYYFISYSLAPSRLYKLNSGWLAASPVIPPAWALQPVTGIPTTPGLITLVEGKPLLFRSVRDELCAMQGGGPNEFYFVKASELTYPAFSDMSALLPAEILALVSPVISLYEDDRRRTNPLQYFMFRDSATATGNTYLASWDGLNPLTILATFSGALVTMTPNDQRADERTFTDQEPAVFVAVPVELFPGQYRLDYTVIDTLSRPIAISPEYSTDGDEYLPMTEGDGSDGTTGLSSSPVGDPHSFVWDSFIDLEGEHENMHTRIVARISGV